MASETHSAVAGVIAVRIERISQESEDVIAYLEREPLFHATDIWNVRFENRRFELYVCRGRGGITAHLGIYHTPEADYVSISGRRKTYVTELLDLAPKKAVITARPPVYELIRDHVNPAAVYENDLMLVRRGDEKLVNPDHAAPLSPRSSADYSSFGSSFNVREVSLEWAEECLRKDIVFGAYDDGRLVSVASVCVRLPTVAVIMGIETKKEYRRMGYGAIVTSAATREALKHSESSTLFVRSDNFTAIRLYHKLGYKRVGSEMYLDIGTGLIP